VTPTPLDKEKCLAALADTMKHDKAKLFLAPVDPVLDKVPDYFERVPKPMDLRTIRQRLENGFYTTNEGVLRDVRLVYENARLYHGHKSPITADALTVTKIFSKAAKAGVKGAGAAARDTLAACEQVLAGLRAHPYYDDFSYDITAHLNEVPDYLHFVSRPLDFETVAQNLRKGVYNVEAGDEAASAATAMDVDSSAPNRGRTVDFERFANDVLLVVNNALAYWGTCVCIRIGCRLDTGVISP